MKLAACTCVLALALFSHGGKVPAQDIVSPSNDLVLGDRDLVIMNGSKVRTRLDSDSGDWRSIDANGNTVILLDQSGSNIFVGGGGRDGDLVLLPREATSPTLDTASVHLDGSNATQRLGGGGQSGRLVLQDRTSQRIFLDATQASLIVGQAGEAGDIIVRNAGGAQRASIDGATGNVSAAGQFRSQHAGNTAAGLDTAALYLESANPSLGLLDNTNGNARGWYLQAGVEGQLVFSTATPNAVGAAKFVLSPNGAICLGACN